MVAKPAVFDSCWFCISHSLTSILLAKLFQNENNHYTNEEECYFFCIVLLDECVLLSLVFTRKHKKWKWKVILATRKQEASWIFWRLAFSFIVIPAKCTNMEMGGLLNYSCRQVKIILPFIHGSSPKKKTYPLFTQTCPLVDDSWGKNFKFR